ncbi:hypothetical protein HPB52_000975 [Rhipicephalus sanguineus]|uniref:Uncharacterized protein n=1 Tax=Rhipicephalus sanguineus TaxID=34632 RepID=A0A9D4QF25_RHISA|nr:hypothetical protein HPB52_000975 [Rhipicephalus sanguineus]
MGLDVREQMRKPEIIEAIENLEADDDELSDCLELIEEEKKEKLRREAEERNERRLERDLEMKRLEVELLKAQSSSEASWFTYVNKVKLPNLSSGFARWVRSTPKKRHFSKPASGHLCVEGVVEGPRLPISDYVPPYYSVAYNIREFNMTLPGEEAVPPPVDPPMPPPPSPQLRNATRTRRVRFRHQ